MKRKTRPSCARCLWCVHRKNDNIGVNRLECFFNPPTVCKVTVTNGSDRPVVRKGDFCHNFKKREAK